jgi:gas vesicle protein
MKKKIFATILISTIYTLTACTGNTQAETSTTETLSETNETAEEMVSEIVEKISDKLTEKASTLKEKIKTEPESTQEPTEDSTQKPTDSSTEITTEATTKTTPEESPQPTKESTPSSNTPTTHTHTWDNGTITQAATCTANGVTTYKCNCGETKTETINAVGHSWVAQTTTVHHDAEGMYQQVKTGTRKVIICHTDRERFYDNESWQSHSDEADHLRYTVTTEDTYKTQWVETSPAWDEPVTTGYICSVCGTVQ